EVRARVLREQVRIDGRGPRDIRPLTAEVQVLPRVHGSALFERGETQILGVTTLNMLRMEQTLDTLAPEKSKRYMHNYNFPPYSTLTDNLGAEDAFADMDFKVAGTREFVTALQLDTKLDGIPSDVLAGALQQAHDARFVILDVMAEAIESPAGMSQYAPRVT